VLSFAFLIRPDFCGSVETDPYTFTCHALVVEQGERSCTSGEFITLCFERKLLTPGKFDIVLKIELPRKADEETGVVEILTRRYFLHF
jgi:hypothetical protein